MDIIFGMYTQNSVRNDKIYINLHHFIIRGHRGQLQTSKSHYRGKKLATPPKYIIFACILKHP